MSDQISISAKILRQLGPIARAQGIDLGLAPQGSDLPDDAPTFPAVNLQRSTSEIAHETGLNLKTSGLYLLSDTLITVEPDGSPAPMDVDRFRTWIDGYQVNYYKRRKSENEEGLGAPIKATLKKDVANVLLRSDEFLKQIPVIRRIFQIPLPVWDKTPEGKTTTRILPYGYDAPSQIYTVNTGIHYPTDQPLAESNQFLQDLLGEFPYGDDGRSLAVQISAMLTLYCQLLFAERDRFPMIYYNANQPGSGKSLLAQIVIYAIYGTAEPLTYGDNDEFTKKLDTWAQHHHAYAFLDDVSGLVKNNDLNRWLTSAVWTFRHMHTQRSGSVINQKLTLLTGNQATLSEDLTRRSLMVDLWSSELAQDRQKNIKSVIDAEWLAVPAHRSKILAALHSLLRHWIQSTQAKPYTTLIPSFEGWSRIIPAIVTAAGHHCPLEKPNVQDAGGKQEVEFLRLIEAAVRDYEPPEGWPVKKSQDILLTDWCRLARSIGVFHSIIADGPTMREVLDSKPSLYKKVYYKDGSERPREETDCDQQALSYMDKSQQTKFGSMLNKYYRGQIREIKGHKYQFASREARHSTFTLAYLGPIPTPETDPF